MSLIFGFGYECCSCFMSFFLSEVVPLGGLVGGIGMPRKSTLLRKGPCDHCGVTKTGVWRKGPREKPILCNACGARWKCKGTLVGYIPGQGRMVPSNSSNEQDDLGDCNFSHETQEKEPVWDWWFPKKSCTASDAPSIPEVSSPNMGLSEPSHNEQHSEMVYFGVNNDVLQLEMIEPYDEDLLYVKPAHLEPSEVGLGCVPLDRMWPKPCPEESEGSSYPQGSNIWSMMDSTSLEISQSSGMTTTSKHYLEEFGVEQCKDNIASDSFFFDIIL